MLKSLAVLALCMPVVFAQVRVTQAVDDQQRVRLPGNRHPLAVRQYDAGAVAPELALDRMILVLTSDAAQQQDWTRCWNRNRIPPRRDINNG